MIIAIDGPAGAGKSTTACAVARRLGFLYLDTGAMYRGLALAFLREGCPITEEAAADLLPRVHLDIVYEEGEQRVLLNGEDVSDAIRQNEVGRLASPVSALAPVRAKMLEEQRRIARAQEKKHGGVVLDGRDIGTVVFPDADLKIFMEADPAERARRRQAELTGRGETVALQKVLDEIEQRDRRDRERPIAPLRRADDAVILDTTGSSFEEQVAFVLARVEERRNPSDV